MRVLGFAACLAIFVGSAASGQEWPQFRGPSGAGSSTQTGLPGQWGAEDHIHWKVKVPGAAWSSPIVWGDKIFLTTAVTDDPKFAKPGRFGGGGFGGPGGGGGGFGGPGGGPGGDGEGRRRFGRPPGDDQAEGDRPERRPRGEGEARPEGEPAADGPRPEGGRRGRGGPGGPGGFGRRSGGSPPDVTFRWEVLCLDRKTGDTLWSQVALEGKPTIPTHSTNTYASETPVTDGERIYAYFGMTGLFCYDTAGKLLWKKNLGSFPMSMDWGTGSSPVLAGDLLCIQCDNEKESFLVAFDKLTGEERWRVPRDVKTNWSSPLVWKNKLRTELVTAGGEKATSYDPATGKVLWEVTGMNGRCSATPVADDERVYFGTGGGRGAGGAGPLVAVKAGASGNIALPEDQTMPEGIAWVAERSGPPMASPVLHDGYLYILDQRGGLLRCHNAKTGELAYRERLPEARGFTASPWAYDGKIFCLDEDGKTFVIAAGPEFKLVGTNALDDRFWASSAIAKGQLLLRGVEHLYCIE